MLKPTLQSNVESWLRHYKVDFNPYPITTKNSEIFYHAYPMIDGINRLSEDGILDPWPAALTSNHSFAGSKPYASYREATYGTFGPTYSIQFILYPNGVVGIDFDKYNPNAGLWPAVAHWFGEVVWHRIRGRQTNQAKVHADLVRRGITSNDRQEV